MDIESVSIDMSPAFIKGVSENLPSARVTFDKFHVIKHASEAIDQTRDQRQYELPLGDTQHGTPTIPRGLITGAV